MQRTSVILLDNKEITRESLAKLLEGNEKIEVVSQCSNVRQALNEVEKLKPDLVLIDGNLSECDSSEAARRISNAASRVNVAVLTDSKDRKELLAAIESGATGYIHKETGVDDFVESIDLVGKGGVVISPQVAGHLGGTLNPSTRETTPAQPGLSEREIEIVRLLAKGATNKKIAEVLFIAENTTKVHVKNILQKLHLRNRQQIAAYAVQQGLVSELTETEDTDR